MDNPKEIIKTMRSFAKINFGLKIVFRYPSGYHHLNSILLPIDFHDEMEVIQTKGLHESQGFKIEYQDELPDSYSKRLSPYFEGDQIKENLLFKAHQWFLNWASECEYEKRSFFYQSRIDHLKNITVKIKKRIPSPSGLGGGSSNAAFLLTTLLGFLLKDNLHSKSVLNKFKKKLKRDALLLGSDIPFFFDHRPSCVTGVGDIEKKKPLQKFSALEVAGVLGIPPYGFPTSLIYQAVNFSLQDESNLLNSHDSYFARLERLMEFVLYGKQSLSLSETQAKTRGTASLIADGVFYVENDLLQAAKKTFPDEARHLNETMVYLGETMYKAMRKTSNDRHSAVCCSMSGSGASFYALGRLSPRSLAHDVLPLLKRAYPDIFWKRFSIV